MSEVLTGASEKRRTIIAKGQILDIRFTLFKGLGRLLGFTGLVTSKPEVVFVGGVGLLTANAITAVRDGLGITKELTTLERNLQERERINRILYPGEPPRVYLPPTLGTGGKKPIKGLRITF